MKRKQVFEDLNRIIVQFGGRPLAYDDKLKNTLLPRGEALSMFQYLEKQYPGVADILMGKTSQMEELPSISEMPMRTLVAICRQAIAKMKAGEVSSGLV